MCVSLEKVTDEQYNKYLNQCMEQGFIVDTKKSTYSYDAFDSEGYSLNLTHIDDNLTITVKAPMKLGTITWPIGTAGDLLPEPSSTMGKFNYEHDTNFSVYVGDTSKEEYDEYVRIARIMALMLIMIREKIIIGLIMKKVTIYP